MPENFSLRAQYVPHSPDEGPINLDALGNRFGDDVAKHASLLYKFQIQTESICGEIVMACEQHDRKVVPFRVHKLKSSARKVDADALADLCQEFELAGRQLDLEKILQLKVKLQPLLENLKGHIQLL